MLPVTPSQEFRGTGSVTYRNNGMIAVPNLYLQAADVPFSAEDPGGYYAAFIRDPDGNRIEAVTFLAVGA